MNFDFYGGRITVDYLEDSSMATVFIELNEVMKYPDRIDYIPLDRCYIKYSTDKTISIRFVKNKERHNFTSPDEAFQAILDFIYRYWEFNWEFTYRYSYVRGYAKALDNIRIVMNNCWDNIEKRSK